MGFNPRVALSLTHILASQEHPWRMKPKRALQIGVQSTHVNINSLLEIFKALKQSQQLEPALHFPDVSNKERDERVPIQEFLNLWNFKTESIDISPYEGAEIIADLNVAKISEYPSLKSRYDLIIDGGSFEHCFNLQNAAEFVHEMLNEKGLVFHANPSNRMLDHGFYQICPTLYHDLYAQSNYSLVYAGLSTTPESLRRFQMYEVKSYTMDIYRGSEKQSVKALEQSDIHYCARKEATSCMPKTIIQGYYKQIAQEKDEGIQLYSYEIDSSVEYYDFLSAIKGAARRLQKRVGLQ